MKVFLSILIVCAMSSCTSIPKPNNDDYTNPLMNTDEFSDYHPWWATNTSGIVMPLTTEE